MVLTLSGILFILWLSMLALCVVNRVDHTSQKNTPVDSHSSISFVHHQFVEDLGGCQQ